MQRCFSIPLVALLMAGCSSPKDDLSQKSADKLYASATSKMKSGDYEDAASEFKEIDSLFPYSNKASFGQVLAAYCQFQASHYLDALASLEVFLRYHPSHSLVHYAMYLRAMCIYMQVASVGRDAKAAKEARLAFLELLNKFPNSSYSRDCAKRVLILDDMIAAHEMSIGRFYQKHSNALSAIGRYNYVAMHLGNTKHCPEAYYRIMECCQSLGLPEEVADVKRRLQLTFPESEWNKKTLPPMPSKKGQK
ncbi:MAG: outer membrane protein assembly factor BamD [Holosporaceae bacterium]|jgi:outer membrane protein assembly factor BamD|nr:outer membrane protein assembly factor BamD [Holosporaceae bacterium]